MSQKYRKEETATERAFREKYGWRKVQAPRSWRPRDPGEELFGYYGGRTLRNGTYGQYEVVVVHAPRSHTYTISGVKVAQLFDASLISKGHPVRVIFKGEEQLSNGHTMRQFELLVAEGDPMREDELPQVREPGMEG